MSDVAELIDRWVRPIPDWPEPGVTFRDITPLIADAHALAAVVDAFVDRAAAGGRVDAVIGIEARGFIFAPAVALRLGVGFVPVRKLGKLPAERLGIAYDLEYGSATVEMHADALRPGARVLVIDDVLATGGTMAAVDELVGLAGATVVANLVLLELSALGGRERLGPVGCTALHTY